MAQLPHYFTFAGLRWMVCEGAVALLSLLFLHLPPFCVVPVPGDGLSQAGLEVGMDGSSPECLHELGRIDGVPLVVSGAIGDLVEGVFRQSEFCENYLQDFDVAPLALGSDQVGFADFALPQDRPHRARVVVDVYPVADVAPVAVKLRPAPCEDVGDLAGDELLHVLIGSVVV